MNKLFRLSTIFSCVILLTISAVFAQKVGPKKGALVIVGGGNIPAAISDKFIELAGGKDANFVYVPTALEDENLKDQKTIFGLKNITVLHTRDRKVADTEEFVATLRKANGVWFGGGRQ